MHHRASRTSSVLAAAVLAAVLPSSGCSWDENLLIYNLEGTVRIPVEAATRDVIRVDASGGSSVETITDVRLIGPVYLGLFPSVEAANVAASYPHPEIGPQYKEDQQGDTYPYGGTTVGDLRFACFEALTCKITSGRFKSYDELLEWFTDIVGTEITGPDGNVVTIGEEIRQTCFDLLEVTSDEEIMLIAPDKDGNDKIDDKDLDFALSSDGAWFEADFVMWQQEWFWDQNEWDGNDENCVPGRDCTGPSLWGFHDTPSSGSGVFSTCNPSAGFNEQTYTNDFDGGATYPDLLNVPTQYLVSGDWVASEAYVWKDVYDRPVIDIDWQIGVTTEVPEN